MSFSQLSALILYAITPWLVSARSLRLDNRDVRDYQIRCEYQRLPDGPYGVGKDTQVNGNYVKWSRDNFTTSHFHETQYMCSFLGHRDGNFGGRCAPSYEGVGYIRRVAKFDIQLSINVGLYETRLLQLCVAQCRCPVSDAELQAELRAAIVAMNGAGRSSEVSLAGPRTSFASIGNSYRLPGLAVQRDPSAPSSQCSSRCDNLRCPQQAGERNPCVCRAVRVAKNTFAPGGCGAQARNGPWGRKRTIDLVDACPCNATYVSAGCCGAGSDGIVWEHPGAKLGVMV